METGPILSADLRTGKTELRLMLEAHPHLCFTRRTYMWTRFYERFGDLGRPENLEKCLTAMLAHEPIRQLQPDLARIRAEFAQASPTYARLFGLFHAHHAVRMGKPRWGDQLGHVEQFAAPIFDAFPTARMIHMVRNPRHVYEEAMARHRQRKGKVGWTTADWLSSVGAGKENLPASPVATRWALRRLMAARQTVRVDLSLIDEDYHPEMLAAAVTDKPKAPAKAGGDAPQPNARMSPGEWPSCAPTPAVTCMPSAIRSMEISSLCATGCCFFWLTGPPTAPQWQLGGPLIPDAMHRTPRYMKQ